MLLGQTLESFNNAKSALSDFMTLNYFKDDDNVKIMLMTDAYWNMDGAVICQIVDQDTDHLFVDKLLQGYFGMLWIHGVHRS